MRRRRSLAVAVATAILAGACADAASAQSGVFTSTGIGTMHQARSDAAAAALPGGRVLIAGGLGSSAIAGAEVFDPATGSFSLTGPMTTTRTGAVAAPLPDGKVLVAGGTDEAGHVLAGAEVYNPATGTFTKTGAMSTGRVRAAAAPLPGGRVLVAGGIDGQNLLQTAEVYDPGTGRFSPTGAMTVIRSSAVASPLPGGKVLIAGGDSGSGGHYLAVASAEVYDPATGGFSTAGLGAMTVPRTDAAAAPLADGRVLIAGGDGAADSDSSAELFDPASGTFSRAGVGALVTPRKGAVAAPLPSGQVLVAGGGGRLGNTLDTAEVFMSAPAAVATGGDFGEVAVGQTSADRTITVTNLGTQTLTIRSTSLAGSNLRDFAIIADGCAGRAVEFRDTCTVTARFTPVARGARSASLVLRDNEPTVRPLPLTGSGVPAPEPPGAPSSSFFSTQGAGSLLSPRAGAAAATLPDGRVLLAGGSAPGGAIATAEVYGDGTFSSAGVGSMSTPRSAAVAAPLPDGKVLVAGGFGPSGVLDSAELFDPASGRFTHAGSMNFARAFAAAAPLPDGRVLVAGGMTGSAAPAGAEIYDPATDAFTQAASMGGQRIGAVAATLRDGRVLIAGGADSSGPLASAVVFDPRTGAFSATGSLTTPRSFAAAARLADGRVLVTGGQTATGASLPTAELFDPATGTFSSAGARAMTTGRVSAAAAPLPDGKVLIAGGNDGSGPVASAELFAPAPQASVRDVEFGAQTVGLASVVKAVTVTNLGAQALRVAGVALGGGAAGDFAITADGCAGRSLPFRQRCTISVRFTPSAPGARSATLRLADNEPAAAVAALSGTGSAPLSGPAGPPGPAGTPGLPGAQGPAGARGPAGRVKVVTCRKAKAKPRRRRCTTKVVRGGRVVRLSNGFAGGA